MLAVAYRLRKKADFQKVYRGGKALNTAFFRIHTMQNGKEASRFGIVIANKHMKGAVARNRKKRQVRSVLSEIASQVIGGYDIVVSAKPELRDAEYEDILKDVQRGFAKIRFLKDE